MRTLITIALIKTVLHNLLNQKRQFSFLVTAWSRSCKISQNQRLEKFIPSTSYFRLVPMILTQRKLLAK